MLNVERTRPAVNVLNCLNVVAPQMGEQEGNMGSNRRTRATGKMEEEQMKG